MRPRDRRAESSAPSLRERAEREGFDLVACELFGVIDEQADDLCVVVAFVPKRGREVVVASNPFRYRTKLGEANAETGQPALTPHTTK